MAKPAQKSFKELDALLSEYTEGIDELYSLYNISPKSDEVQKMGIRAAARDLNKEDPLFDFSSLYDIIESGVQIIKRTIQLLETDSDTVQPCSAMEMPRVLSDEDRRSLWPEVIQHERKMIGIIKDLKMCKKTSPVSQELGEMVNNTRRIYKEIISIYTEVCKTCAKLEDSSYWELTIPSEDTTGANVKYSVSSTAGMYECSETGLRWGCVSEVSLEYHFVDWKSQKALKEMDFEPCGPLMDITVTSGTLEEIYLPHFICVDSVCSSHAEVKAFHVKDGVISLERCELTRFHAKLLNPTFCLWGIIAQIQQNLTMKFHCETLIYRSRSPHLNLHVYLFVRDRKLEKDVKEKERGSMYIHKPSPDDALKIFKRYTLTSSCASSIKPQSRMLKPRSANFFDVNITDAEDDFELHLNAAKRRQIWDVDIHLADCNQATHSTTAGNRAVHDILLGYLDDLNSGELDLFKWYLSNGVENFSKVPKCFLEGSERWKVVTCLIERYKEAGAAEVTAIILRKMQKNNDADRLERKLHVWS